MVFDSSTFRRANSKLYINQFRARTVPTRARKRAEQLTTDTTNMAATWQPPGTVPQHSWRSGRYAIGRWRGWTLVRMAFDTGTIRSSHGRMWIGNRAGAQ